MFGKCRAHDAASYPESQGKSGEKGETQINIQDIENN
jgi:hypothetical protein